jgi:hypothetical protein
MLTDICQEQINALKAVWPSVISLLCIFHILQQDGDGCWIRINQNARTEILGLLKKALYATSEDMFEESFDELLDEMEETYPQAFKYFEGLYVENK